MKKIFKKIIKKIGRKKNVDEERCVHLSKTEGKVFIKYVELLVKVSNIIKNTRDIIVRHIYSKNSLKAEKKNSMFICTNNAD